MQGGLQSGTEGLGELPREEWLVVEKGGSQLIQYQT